MKSRSEPTAAQNTPVYQSPEEPTVASVAGSGMLTNTPNPDRVRLTSTGIQNPGEITTPRVNLGEVPDAPCKFGEYELIEEIARGGMGVVYRARQAKLNRTVALKMILPGMLSSSLSVNRFYQEAQAAAILDHPNIVPIYDIGEIEHRHYFTMAFIEGLSLRDLVRKGTPSFRDAVTLLQGIAEGVGFAHEHGIIHRDMKPDNVLIDKLGRPRVTDFGLAKRVDADSGLTATGQILGTPTYMSPEQALGGSRDIGPATDIYALGGILYYTLTGKPPFQGETMTEVLCQVVSNRPTSPVQFNPDIPYELESICLKCLEKNPADRFLTAKAFQEALLGWLESTGIMPKTSGSIFIDPMAITGAERSNPSKTPTIDSVFPSLNRKMAPPTGSRKGSTLPQLDRPGSFDEVPQSLPGSNSIAYYPQPEPPVVKPRSIWPMLAVAAIVFAGVIVVGTQWDSLFGKKNKEVVVVPPEMTEKKEIVIPRPFPKTQPSVAGKKEIVPELLPTRKDFKLFVEMIGGTPKGTGVREFREGDKVRFDITAEIDCYVGVWTVDEVGNVEQVFPHARLDAEHKFLAGEKRTVPSPNRNILMTVPQGGGKEQVWIMASDQPWDPKRAGVEADINYFEKERNFQEWERKHRGMRLEENRLMSEAMLRYEVKPEKK